MALGYQAISCALRDLGVSTLYGVMGDGNLHLIQAWVHEAGGRYVAARHEAGAVNMADGHARVLAPAGLGAATVTHGPGLTNALTALTAAARNRTPLLLLAGDLPRAAVRHSQRIDQRAVVAPSGAGYVQVSTAAGAERQVTAAARQALLERRPVVLDVANDVQREEWAAMPGTARLRALADEIRGQRTAPDPAAVARVAARLASARRPLILAGRGAVWSGAGPALASLADRAGALLGTTLLGTGLFAGQRWNVGVVGTFGSAGTQAIVRTADFVLAVGASLHTWTTDIGRAFPDAFVVQVDTDTPPFADFTPVDMAVLGDARSTALAVRAALDTGQAAGRGPAAGSAAAAGFRTADVRMAIDGSHPDDEITDASPAGRTDPRLVLTALNAILPAERIVVCDGGHFFSYPGRYLSVPEPESFVFAANFGAIGLGLGTAIGAAMARPDRLCVAVTGDGGLLMSIADLETAVRYRIPLVLVVLNDAAYGAEVHSLRAAGLPADTAQFPDTDFVRLAEGFGAAATVVEDSTDLEKIPPLLDGLHGPLVLDVKIDPDLVAPWYYAAKIGPRAR